MTKQYYKCLKIIDGITYIDYWHTANPKDLLRGYDMMIPIGTRKPYKIPKESIKE